MAEKIKLYNSYYKEINLYVTDIYGNDVPVDLSIYNDNYVVLKKNRETLDEDAFLIKKIIIDEKSKPGAIPIFITPEETQLLPLTNEKLPYFYMFVVLGSNITGETKEAGTFKVKTEYSGLRKWTKIDTDMSDLESIKNPVSFVYDCGNICEPTIEVLDLSGGEPYVLNLGYILDYKYDIVDLGKITEESEKEWYNGGYIREGVQCGSVYNR